MHVTDQVEMGRTGVHVARLGLGGVALSGAPPATDPHQTTSEADAIAIIQRSLALGLNYLDTAPMYGVGHSEKRYGQALHGRARDRQGRDWQDRRTRLADLSTYEEADAYETPT